MPQFLKLQTQTEPDESETETFSGVAPRFIPEVGQVAAEKDEAMAATDSSGFSDHMTDSSESPDSKASVESMDKCRYCYLTDPAALVHCDDCSKWFCNGKGTNKSGTYIRSSLFPFPTFQKIPEIF